MATKVYCRDLTGKANLNLCKEKIDEAGNLCGKRKNYQWEDLLRLANAVMLNCSEKEMSNEKWKEMQKDAYPYHVVGFINQESILNVKNTRAFREMARILEVVKKINIREKLLNEALEAKETLETKNLKLAQDLDEEKRYCFGIRLALDMANRDLHEAQNFGHREKMNARYFEQKYYQCDYDYGKMAEDLKFYERFYHSFAHKI